MGQQPPVPPSTKHQRWLLRKQAKEANRHRARNTDRFKRVSVWVLTTLVVGGGIGWLIWQAAAQPPIPAGDIVAKNGIHWHPDLSISIKGAPREIAANLGIGAVHNPMHTHDSTGVIHLEFQGRVTKDDLRLGQFFKVWNKPFSSTCIIDKCNGSDGQVKMTVNGQPNTEFDQYVMQDKDKIEIRYE